MKNELKKSYWSAGFLSLALLVTACGPGAQDPVTVTNQGLVNGQQPPVVTNPIYTGCHAGSFGIGGSGCFTRLEDACRWVGGALLNVSGKQFCRYEMAPTATTWKTILSINRLHVGTPFGPNPHQIGYVRKNDTISLKASGGWGGGSSSDSKYQAIFGAAIDARECDAVNPDGKAVKENLSSITTPPAGMMATDGKEVFFVGSAISGKVIQNDGILSVGYNVPNGVGTCSDFQKVELTITRCEDGLGGTTVCN